MRRRRAVRSIVLKKSSGGIKDKDNGYSENLNLDTEWDLEDDTLWKLGNVNVVVQMKMGWVGAGAR